MHLRTTHIVFIALFLALSSACAFGQATYRVVEKPTAFLITGSAANIDRLREFVEIVDHGNTYMVLTGRATIVLQGGKAGTTQDLKEDSYIQVSGEQLSARTILASTVVVLEASAAKIVPQGYRPNDHIETSGSVTGVNASSGEIDIRTDTGNYALLVKSDTVIRRYIYVTDISDINEGDGISFTGAMARDGRIIADRIQVSAAGIKIAKTNGTHGYRPTYLSAVSRSQQDSIEGQIISPPSSFDRSLALSTTYGERKVDVLKSAEVRIDKLPASVHDLAKGDYIRVIGTWDSDTMIATRVETSAPSSAATYRVEELPAPAPEPAPAPAAPETPAAPANPAPAETATAPAEPANPPAPAAPEPAKASAITGRIVAIDYTNLDLSVDAGLKDNKVDARDAVVTRQGSTRRFSELKKGDKVEVKGDWNGDVLKATSVDVVE